MPRRNDRGRPLFLQVMARSAPERWPLKINATPIQVLERLMISVEDESYLLPRGWDIVIYWRNKRQGEWRFGDWTTVLQESTESGRGFDLAMLAYLESQLKKAEDQAERRRRGRLQG